jgi:hypothetical protein
LWTSGDEPPVFADHSGRRARGVRVAGFAVAVLCAVWLGALMAGMAGFSRFPPARPAIHALHGPADPDVVRARIPRAEQHELISASPERRERAS